ncbi:MAG: hypothetical protein A3G41_01695 [Elusimicrobia bacterium RIFCSPLOWO2_12_FULL_59_9]|nr:MAG: hypothetical protein A3G41_01695 [Elusimicrobia bacterium RIFCSPLOWO2_12_FULL_59_9]
MVIKAVTAVLSRRGVVLDLLRVGLLPVLGGLLSFAAFGVSRSLEEQKIAIGFERDSTDVLTSLQRKIDENLNHLEAVYALYAASEEVERGEFREFARPLLSRHASIQALEWVPYKGNEAALGYDLASNPARRQALRLARDTGKAAATAPVRLIQEKGRQRGFLIYWPIYRRQALTDSVAARRQNLRGFALGVFRAGDLVEEAAKYFESRGLDLYLEDPSAPENARFLHYRPARPGRTAAAEKAQSIEADFAAAALFRAAELEVGGRKWSLLLKPGDGYLEARRTWHPFGVLLSGLLFTALIAMHLTSRRRSERALGESEEKYRKLFENDMDALIIFDAETGRIEDVNRAAAAVFGFRREEFLGLNFCDVFGEPEEAERALQRVLEGRNPGQMIVECRLRKKDGALFSAELSAGVFVSNGRAKIIAAGRDVTLRKTAQEKEKLLQQRLMQADKMGALGKTLSGVTHELNNPLTAIIGYCQLLLKDGSSPPSQDQQDIAVMLREALRCRKIIQNLSSFARQNKPEKARVSINEIIENCQDLVAYQLHNQNILMSVELDPDLPGTMADTQQLQQVFLNLFLNAQQAMSGGDDGGTLRVQTSLSGDWIRVVVEDDGPGVAAENVHRIFDPFFTTRDVGQGAGLGLSIAYGIIAEHGGNLSAQSRPGKGGCFIVELPVLPLAGAAPAAERSAAAGRPAVALRELARKSGRRS